LKETPFTPFLKTLLASNSLVHEDLLAALRIEGR
jgi:hypothetical protein